MSLEAKIELLTSAVIELTAAIGAMQAPVPIVSLTPEQEERLEKAIVKPMPVVLVPNGQSKSMPATSQTSEEPSRKVEYNDVAKLVTQIAKSNIPKAKAALARLGVKHGKELTEAQWPEAVTYLTRVAAGEVDPEASHE